MSIIDHNDLLLQLEDCTPSRVAANKVLRNLRNSLEPPARGEIVGYNGPDYSFRLSLIKNDEFGRRGNFPTYKLLRNLIQPHSKDAVRNGYKITSRMLFAEHAHLEVCKTSKEGIRSWTTWASRYGVKHDGKWGYQFPLKRVWNTQQSVTDDIYYCGGRKSGDRKDTSRKRRAERRKFLASARSGMLRMSPQPFKVVNSPSASVLRKRWFANKEKVPFSVFKQNNPQTKRISLANAKYSGILPDICTLALSRIYSRSMVLNKTSKRVEVVSTHIPIVKLEEYDNKQVCLDRIRQIESDGFKETYTWFYLNHILTKLDS